jgi:maltokinase
MPPPVPPTRPNGQPEPGRGPASGGAVPPAAGELPAAGPPASPRASTRAAGGTKPAPAAGVPAEPEAEARPDAGPLAEPTVAPEQLAELLRAWLPGQRWFAGKGRRFDVAEVRRIGPLTGPPYPSAVWLIRLRYADGGTESYQVPLVCRPVPVDTLTHVLVGELPEPGTNRPVWWYDALHDKEVTDVWLRHLERNQAGGGLTFHLGPNVDKLPTDKASLVLTVEQSNTSLVYGDAAILKVFRRIVPGVNPDIEVHEALARAGADRHVAKLLGYVSASWAAGDGSARVEASLAMLQEFFRTASDGWELAKTSVRDLYAEGDLHPDEVGGDFAGEAHRLGVATAEMHADLARALPTGILGRSDLAELAAIMRARLEEAARVVPELAEYAPGLQSAYDAVEAHEPGVPVQRIHGDFHLGQVLRTVHRWVVLDFEGEPVKPLAERVALESPLRDVAGMLRSFDYAARHLLADHPHRPQLVYRAEEWADRNRSAFCEGYAEGGGGDPREDSVLLRAYEADKAVYEAVYEARNRPSWLSIPLSSMARLTEGVAG